MKEKNSGKDYTPDFVHAFRYVFRGGNLIFPLILGAKAGKDMPLALLGMLVSAVGFPLLGIISMGISKSEGLLDMAGRVSKGFAYFFHLRPLSDHRAVFCHSPLRSHLLCGGICAPFRVSTGLFFQLIFTLLFLLRC